MAHPTIQIPFKKLSPLAITPFYNYSQDSGVDLFSIEAITLLPRSINLIRTGLSIEIPIGYEGQIRSRSGMAAKWGVAVINSPGCIDAGYTGEIKVALINHSDDCYRINVGDRIAQLVIAPTVQGDFLEVTEQLVSSARGSNGFGSTGTR